MTDGVYYYSNTNLAGEEISEIVVISDYFPRNFTSFPGEYLKDLEAVLDVLRVDLRDEEKVAHLPRVQRRLGAALGPAVHIPFRVFSQKFP